MHGFLLVDKSSGIRSTQLLNKIKSLLKSAIEENMEYVQNKNEIYKIGYLGVLDEYASGLLPIAIGHATKFLKYFPDSIKTYVFSVQWGIETDTNDITGKILRKNQKYPTQLEIEGVLKHFYGYIPQEPPMFSNILLNGIRAHEMARENKNFSIPPREIFVKSLEIIEHYNTITTFRIACGPGTYVRAIARDLAKKLRTISAVIFLRRTSIMNAHPTINDIHLLKKIVPIENAIIPVEDLFHYEKYYMSESEYITAQQIRYISTSNLKLKSNYYKLIYNNNFIGIGERDLKSLKINFYSST